MTRLATEVRPMLERAKRGARHGFARAPMPDSTLRRQPLPALDRRLDLGLLTGGHVHRPRLFRPTDVAADHERTTIG